MIRRTKSRRRWWPCFILFLCCWVSHLRATGAETNDTLDAGFSPHRIQFEGAHKVSADDLREALAWDPVMLITALPGAPMDEVRRTVVSRLTEGYLRAGFLTSHVEAIALDDGNIMVKVEEGEQVFIESLVVTGNTALASGVVMDWLIQPREQAMSERSVSIVPFVKTGMPASGDAEYLRSVVTAVEEFYNEHGFWDIQVDASFSKPVDGQVSLMVTIEDEGQRLEIDRVQVLGARINDDAVIAGYSGITTGLTVTAAILSDAQQRLMRSGRFAVCDVRIDRGALPDGKAGVVIQVTEIDGHPGLDEPDPEMATLFQQTQDWLVEHLFRSEQEYLLQFTYSNQVAELIVGGQGMAASLQVGDTMWSAFVDGVDFGLVTRRPGATNAVKVRGAGVFSPFVSIDCKPAREPGGKNWSMSLGAGYNSNTQQSKAALSVRIHPAAYLQSALSLTNTGVRVEDHDGRVAVEFSISNQWTRLELDKESGGLLSVTNRHMDNGRLVTFGRSQDQLGSRIAAMTSLIPGDHTVDAGAQGPGVLVRFALKSMAYALVYSGRPFNSLLGVKEALAELLCEALTEAENSEEPSPPGINEEHVRLVELFDRLIDEVVPLSLGNPGSTNTSFVIPFDEKRDEQSVRMATVAGALKNPMGSGLVFALFDWSAPPARLIRGITLAQNGFPREGDLLMRDAMHDKAMGPVSWYLFGSGTSPAFAQLGLMSCRQTTMEAELSWLLDPQSGFGALALNILPWLVNLNPADWTLLASRAGLSAPAATAFSDTMTELREGYEASPEEEIDWPQLVASALQPWWESGGRKRVASVFISRGAHVNERQEGTLYTPLHTLAHDGDAEGVALLLDLGAKVNSFGPQMTTPLHLAAAKSHAEVAELLLGNGADANAQNTDGYTPLHFAVRNTVPAPQRGAVIEALMLAGADPAIRSIDKHSWSALDMVDHHIRKAQTGEEQKQWRAIWVLISPGQ